MCMDVSCLLVFLLIHSSQMQSLGAVKLHVLMSLKSTESSLLSLASTLLSTNGLECAV